MCASRASNEWSGKVAVVAGASSGVGRGLAERLVAEGAIVGLLARRRELLEEMAAELGDAAVPLVADLSDASQVTDAFAAIDRRTGRLDALFNVAGTARAGRLEHASDDDIHGVVGTNLLGPMFTMRAAIPLLRRSAGGDIVNVSSEIVLDDLPLLSLYRSTKAGLGDLSRSMTRELRSDGIRVTLVILGRTGGTGFSENFSADDLATLREAWAADGYAARAGGHTPMDVADVTESILFAATRPRGVVLDVVHVRSSGLAGAP